MEKEKIIQLFSSIKEKHPTFYKVLLSIVSLLIASVAIFLTCTSCSIVNRSSASGTRQVKKQLEQTYEWDIPAATASASYKYSITNNKHATIMYTIKKLKLNTFVDVPIEEPRTLYEKHGYTTPADPMGIDIDASADDLKEIVATNFASSKIGALYLAEQVAKKRIEFKQNPEAATPLHIKLNKI